MIRHGYLYAKLSALVIFLLTQAKTERAMVQPLAFFTWRGQGFTEYPERKPYDLKQINPAGRRHRAEIWNLSLLNTRIVDTPPKLFTDYLWWCQHHLYRSHTFYNTFRLCRPLLHSRTSEENEINPDYGPATGRPAAIIPGLYFTIQAKIGLMFGRPRSKINSAVR